MVLATRIANYPHVTSITKTEVTGRAAKLGGLRE